MIICDGKGESSLNHYCCYLPVVSSLFPCFFFSEHAWGAIFASKSYFWLW